MKLILASQSPRRKELLQSLGLSFTTVKIEVDEVYPQNLDIVNIPGYLSELKAKAHQKLLHKDEVLITADTIVALDDEVLGKPKNRQEAQQMLKKLSGRKHQVITAVTFSDTEKYITKTDVAKVSFAPISDEEINYYIQNYQPFDKAGGYGIQEWIGMAKINNISGSFYTIMGLPTHLVYEVLKELGYDF
ncbi:Maf family nucleotide pyrophosphatase [Elizabethkingia sp. JS20170427COW]|uniref:Maf family nucleotide pyrophosphatase n=1 Tax=Elizabethkingia sp. JS20170427COW TaxID=2583851 RepID=UPI0011108307|nr:Maf family nucleotide pyrophosphatase [Elizabethkingia sp. JS20170427COW]QCX53146.1 septum formation protein Maf [Elizabethkingia sp. JS20170427COW]